MWAFPYERYSIISDLNPHEATLNLASAIYIPDGKKYDKEYDTYSTKYFVGYVNNDGFEIRPDITYRNSFLPDIKGSIKPFLDGAEINIKVRTWLGYVFMIILIPVLLFIGIAINVTAKRFNSESLIPFCGFFCVYGLALFAFKYESRNAKRTLLYLFEGEIKK